MSVGVTTDKKQTSVYKSYFILNLLLKFNVFKFKNFSFIALNNVGYLYINAIDFEKVKRIREHFNLSRMSLDAAAQTIDSILIINRLRHRKKLNRKFSVINAQTIRTYAISKDPSI